MKNTPIGLKIVVTKKKYLKVIDVIPEIKQSISSGKKGSRKATPKNKRPLSFRIFAYLIAFSFPATQITNLCPSVLPNKNDKYDPSKTPIVQYTKPQNGP